MLRAALAYAARLGVAVHPISRSKSPLSPHGFKDATTDEKQIREWWTRYPDANIGARCDAFFVVDVDPRNEGHTRINLWGLEHGDFPTTWEAETGSGGLHIYFQHDPALDAIPLGKLVDGIDIKGGSRGYVLLPPSVSTAGRYTWLTRPSACDLAPAPRWLIDLIVEKKSRARHAAPPVDMSGYAGGDRVERARRYASRLPIAVSGQNGHNTTIYTACLIARGFALTEHEAYAVMSEWNARCKPPWSEHDLRRKIAQTLDHGTAPMGFLLERGRRAA